MIRRIAMHGFKSFNGPEPVTINFDQNKRVALFYGVNGAGKSAIGEVLARYGKANAVPHCTVEFTRAERYQLLVYNEAFVDRTFRNRADVPGIFTIGEPGADALQQAMALEAKMTVWKEAAEQLGADRRARQEEAESVDTVAHESTWSAYTDQKGTVFQPWLGGFGNSKQKLFEWLSGMSLPLEHPPSKNEVTKRLTDLGEQGAQPREVVRHAVPEFSAIESQALWAEPVVPMGQSQMADLIGHLGNADWVRGGQHFLAHSDERCPFCQQHLPDGFADRLAQVFDTTYTECVTRIGQLASTYIDQLEDLASNVDRLFDVEPYATEDTELRLAWSEAVAVLRQNAGQMATKQKAPASRVKLVETASVLAPVVQGLARVANRVLQYNERLGRWQAEYEAIKRDFYAHLRSSHDATIAAHREAMERIDRAIAAIDAQQVEYRDQIHAGEDRLVLLRRATAGTDAAVAAINDRLLAIGVDSFRIAKRPDGDFYHLVRGDNQVDDYQSLSEGEKTLITFLYFVELVGGSEAAESSVPLNRKIVVIDDPISSLSHNYVYDVAATIVHDLIELKDAQDRELKQVIVLTHSLFFHHELLSVVGNARRVDLHRVRKHVYSGVVPLGKDDILNDYEAYWQIIRDARGGAVPPATVANAMRCILERFFSFTKRQDSLKDALRALSVEDHRFVPLGRYLDRQSHADGNTRTDFSDYDLEYYLAKFEAVFVQANQAAHYRAMLGIGEKDAA